MKKLSKKKITLMQKMDSNFLKLKTNDEKN